MPNTRKKSKGLVATDITQTELGFQIRVSGGHTIQFKDAQVESIKAVFKRPKNGPIRKLLQSLFEYILFNDLGGRSKVVISFTIATKDGDTHEFEIEGSSQKKVVGTLNTIIHRMGDRK